MLGFRVELFLARSSMMVTSIVDEVVVSNRGKARSSWRRLFGKGTGKSRDVRRSKADDYRLPSDSFCRGHVVLSAELVRFVDTISRHIQSRMIDCSILASTLLLLSRRLFVKVEENRKSVFRIEENWIFKNVIVNMLVNLYCVLQILTIEYLNFRFFLC